METPDSDSILQLSPHVCIACKARKRKCDKALPLCGQCVKRNVSCDYSSQTEGSTPALSLARFWSSLHSDDTCAQSLAYPTALFLDPKVLRFGQIEILGDTASVSDHFVSLLGDSDEIHSVASRFFEHIHSWLPFVSKKRLYETHLRSASRSKPDIVLLLLSMKLITTTPPPRPRDARTPLYHALKHLYLEIEVCSTLSMPFLQAGIILALYELLHAIYPAAYLSIGICARYAHALGINVGSLVHTRRALTLVEAEERRRVWWTIVILDRFVNIGCPGRPFVTGDPGPDDILPADDASWDEGNLKADEHFTLSTPTNSHMSRFALLCQAARLLGQVLCYVSATAGLGIEDDAQGIQLDRTLRAMLAAALGMDPNMDLPDCNQVNFIYSTIVALHLPRLQCNSESMLNHRSTRNAHAAIELISEQINNNLITRNCFSGRDPESVSPWGLFFAYHLCRIHTRLRRTLSISADIVRTLRMTFHDIDKRWRNAGEYLHLLEAHEAIESN